MKYDLIISDFDWTLGEAPDVIDEGTVKAIKEYEKKGGKFVIATGRSFSSIQAICNKYNLTGLTACFQGAVVADIKSGKQLYSKGIPYKYASKIYGEMKKENVPVIAWANDVLYYKEDSYYSDMYKNTEDINFIQTDDIVGELLKSKCPISKFCAVTGEKETETIEKRLSEKFAPKFMVNSGSKRLVEVIQPKYNKGYAVKKIAKYYNVPLDRVMTVGDSTNDYDLINGKWHGVAVGDAVEKLKAVAKEVTVPYSEHPVKVLLEKYS